MLPLPRPADKAAQEEEDASLAADLQAEELASAPQPPGRPLASAASGDLAARLGLAQPSPLILRTNSGILPHDDDISVDHQRLLERLCIYGLKERQIPGDGNCQFRALSDQLYGSPEHHKFVRKAIVTEMKNHPERYSEHVPGKFSDYVKKMGKSGEWGDHVTLQAAADHWGVKVSLVTSFKDQCFVEISPRLAQSDHEIWLSFWAEIHYNSIYLPGEQAPIDNDPKKKKHWLF
eukprot:SM000006S19384  [mRNA]  locus=s6:393609:395719:- [translate_table: standard]